jgi:flagellar motor switch protein FliM
MEAAPPKTPPAGLAAQTMSQSEVEKLLALVGGGDTVSADVNAPNGEGSGGPVLVSHHDFPQVSSFSADQLRKLRVRCEAFISSMMSRLSAHLRLECTLQLIKLETVRYQQFVNGLPGPTHLTLFKLEPMAGVCLLEIPTRLALSIVDREMGGPGQCDEEPRDLTQIEAKLAAKVITVMLGEWCGIWADTMQLRPLLVRNETSGRFLQTSPSESMMLSLAVETKVGQLTEQIHLAFPQSILDPIMQKLCQDLQNVEKATASPVSARTEWNPLFNDVPLQITARWHALEMSARQISELKIGDVVPLFDAGLSPVELSLDTTPKFSGQLGTAGKKLAVKIVQAL